MSSYDDVTGSTKYLPFIRLFDKQKEVDEGKIEKGHYGLPRGEHVADLGETIDVIPLARRKKAVDTSHRPIVTSYDVDSAEFKDIRERSAKKNSGCMFGVSFLLLERNSGRFVELFLFTVGHGGECWEGEVNTDPIPIRLGCEVIKRQFVWRIPKVLGVVEDWNTDHDPDVVAEQIDRFVNPPSFDEDASDADERDR
jgi:hypothetical protein